MNYKTIAKKANVSVSTVSKALSKSKEISTELRDQIVKIAMECGYFTEKGKRKIENSNQESITVAVICPEIISVTYAGEITAIKNQLEDLGALTAVYVYDFSTERLNEIIKELTIGNRADGIILFAEPSSVKLSSQLPIVCISSAFGELDSVGCDENVYMTDIVTHLASLGHSDIAFVGETNTVGKQNAFRAALNRLGLTANDRNLHIINGRFESIGYAAAAKIISQKQKPTAIVCAYDEIALSLMHCFAENGIKVPEDISIVGINDIPMSAYSLTPLTTVRIFEQEQAAAAIRLLYARIFENPNTTQHVTVRHELILRESTAVIKEH